MHSFARFRDYLIFNALLETLKMVTQVHLNPLQRISTIFYAQKQQQINKKYYHSLKKSWKIIKNRNKYLFLDSFLSNFFIFLFFSCGPSSEAMVSRRKILSRSRDDLHLESGAHPAGEPEEEDIWFNKDKLYKVSRASQHDTTYIVTTH